MSFSRWTIIAIAIVIGVAPFGANAAKPAIQVVTSTSVFADFIEQVGGERVEVFSIVPPGADPHTFEPTPREARSIATADLLVINGLGYEAWVEKLIHNAASPDLRVLVLSEGLEPLEGVSFSAHHHHEHDHHDGDPHFWLDVTYAMHYVRRIEEALSTLDPEGATLYRDRSSRYLAELEKLDGWIFERIAQIPPANRVLLTHHDAFAYMATRYGLTLQGVLVRNPDREPSARELATLIQEVRRMGIKAIFAEPQINSTFAHSLAREARIRVAFLYSDALTSEVPSYIELMRYNANSLVEALQ